MEHTRPPAMDIAIIGYHGRFPGADSPEALWRNLRDGVEAIRHFSEAELQAAGVPEHELRHPHYVRAAAVLDHVDCFDAAFFGITPRDAELMDPQHRLFLESCWAALEHAGYNPRDMRGRVGLFGGARTNTYLFQLAAHPDLVQSVGIFHLGLVNDLGFLTTRVSHALNLTGPSCAVQTACSTSLVAVHLAARSLAAGECDVALAGGVAISVPHVTGYVVEDGGVLSADGHCRVFDAGARGTIFGSGVGIVVLKRLTEATKDGDFVHALVKGSAVNNDGSAKASFTAPSVRGQVAAIADALDDAGVSANEIGYVEAHGTGTLLGDAVEVRALTKAYRRQTTRRGYCALGSVKTNVGHLDAAAGVTGLIKVVESLKHEQIPPSLHYERANPQITFDESPFHVNASLADWPATTRPRRAGISAFGVGGTNAHVIVEEAPTREASSPSRPWQLLLWSGQTPEARDRVADQLGTHLSEQPDVALADVAYTLQAGRPRLRWPRAVVCRDNEEASRLLQSGTIDAEWDGEAEERSRVVMVLPGQGSQRAGMGRELYEREALYREAFERCAAVMQAECRVDLRATLFDEPAFASLHDTWFAQPALFATEYAVACLWLSWGIRPAAVVGHSVGEYVAACLASVMTPEDAMRLIIIRGRLMQEMPRGAMLAVEQPPAALAPLLETDTWLTAINADSVCTVGGTPDAIDRLAQRLQAAGHATHRLRTSHAYHTPLMAGMVSRFVAEVARVPRQAPRLPYVSNVTGDWITAEDVEDPEYWGRHVASPVQFAQGLETALADAPSVVIEAGPGGGLARLLRRTTDVPAWPSLGGADQSDLQTMLRALGCLWAAGVEIDWPAFYAGERRQRVPLPTYPFARTRHWIDAPVSAPDRQTSHEDARAPLARVPKLDDVQRWFWTPSWKLVPRQAMRGAGRQVQGRWLIFVDAHGLGDALVTSLRAAGARVVVVSAGTEWRQTGPETIAIDPGNEQHYQRLARELRHEDHPIDHVVHLWGVRPSGMHEDFAAFERVQARFGVDTLLFAARHLIHFTRGAVHALTIVTSDACAIERVDRPSAANAPALTFATILGQESSVATRAIEIAFEDLRSDGRMVPEQLLDELTATSPRMVAYRGRNRWTPEYTQLSVDAQQPPAFALRERGVYLITGGAGSVGQLLARQLAESCRARLCLVNRRSSVSRETAEAIEAAGGEVCQVFGDVADPAVMRDAVKRCEAEFGALHGVIHAAGITSGTTLFRTLAEATPDHCREQARPKVGGVQAIDEAIRDLPVDFVLLLSSNAAVLGGLGFLSYAAANAAMDTFAIGRDQLNGRTRWITTNWDHWPEETRKYVDVSTSMDEYAMTVDEARRAFDLAVGHCRGGQVVIATGDLRDRLTLWVNREPNTDHQAATPAPTPAAERRPRPRLRAVFAPPEGDAEVKIAAVWSTFLGIEPIGRHDDFFELGGHSLLAVQMMTEIGRVLDVDAPLRGLFEGPTVAQLAEVCLPSPAAAQESKVAHAGPA